MTTVIGTCYFVSLAAAVRYYHDYEHDAESAVKKKLAEGSIHVGKPALKIGQTLKLNTEEGRYFIVQTEK